MLLWWWWVLVQGRQRDKEASQNHALVFVHQKANTHTTYLELSSENNALVRIVCLQPLYLNLLSHENRLRRGHTALVNLGLPGSLSGRKRSAGRRVVFFEHPSQRRPPELTCKAGGGGRREEEEGGGPTRVLAQGKQKRKASDADSTMLPSLRALRTAFLRVSKIVN